nr:rho guanine nucleotide exchange factor 28 isoform X2 [Nothobranchius furzeri]
MEVNRKEVPLYGQVESQVMLQERLPEDALFYVVVRGSRLTHVTAAKTGDDEQTLSFVVPGHDRAEVVSVTAYCYRNDQFHPCQGKSYIKYLRDVAQEAAEFFSANRDQFGPQSYQEVLSRFPMLGQAADEELGDGLFDCSKQLPSIKSELDERITEALANMEYLQKWRNTYHHSDEVAEHPNETLLHLAVHLGLPHLAHFLIHPPRGQEALMSPDEEGETLLQLAQTDGFYSMFRTLTDPSGPEDTPPPGVWCLWSDSSRMLRLCPRTGSVILSVQQPPESCPLDAIKVLREKLEDNKVYELISVVRFDAGGDKRAKVEGQHSDEGISKDLHENETLSLDNVFEEQTDLFLTNNDGEEDIASSLSVNGLPTQTSEDQEFNQQETNDLISMINSGDQQTQAGDVDFRYRVCGVTRDSTETDDNLWDTDDLLATDTPPPHSEDLHPPSCPLSPVDQALTRLNRSVSTQQTNHRDSPTRETCDRSLVALELDSEEETMEPKSSLSPLLSDVGKSEEKRDAFHPAPNLPCTRSQSASTCEPTSKDTREEGVRLRSYSYSSPKISFLPTRHHRDNHTSELSHEQRASSVSEHSEKREARFRKRAQSADDEGSAELAESLQHLTLSEFLKEIEEEELEKCNIPIKAESEKYKVIRTLSFLKSKMSSTRNKSKGKGKDREAKDKLLNGHLFASGSCLGPTVCVVCDKPASGKDFQHCSGCTTIVHKGCKESVPPCLKKHQDKYAPTSVRNKTASLPQNFTVRESPPQPRIPISLSQPVLVPNGKRESVMRSCSLSGSLPNNDSLLSEGSETESDVQKRNSQSEELLPTPVSSVSNESSLGDDGIDSYILIPGDISADSVDYESESWSLTVEPKFCNKQDKRDVKRQDVIYELMQTELHHLQTLHIMAEVFRRGMKEEVQLDEEAVERVFPCLDQLLLFHHGLFAAMKERRQNSAQPQGDRNYIIQQIGDVLIQQFSDENGEKMKQVYGEFCSRHNEAVSFFKELQQHNKRFHSFVKQQGNNSLVRRREIPECILLVTQRITKYPVLLERILHYTQEETEEHTSLSKALALIREVIAAVDLRVSEYELHQRLQEVWSRTENRSTAKLKSGYTFRKQDMMRSGQRLRHEGLLLWKTATGRLKDVLALLLTDALIFLQEKDQKYAFATVDQKPPVIPLQKLIVREVANEEKGMFLISASSAGPEMYEVHTSSKEERNTWMRLIREAVESCPEEQEEYTSESEEEKRAAEARFHKILKLHESLSSQDQQICSCLEEKLQIYSALTALRRTDVPLVEPRLLVQPHSEEPPQAAGLLAAALKEAENLKASLSSGSPSSPGRDSDSVFLVIRPTLSDPVPLSEAFPDSAVGSEENRPDAYALQPEAKDHNFIHSKVTQSVHSLTQLLYSLQAAVTIQDTYFDVQRLLLQESGRPTPRALLLHLSSFRGNTLLEQEKQRNLEKQKEEVVAAQRLQDRLRQEKERWERECQSRESQQEELESRLEEREKQYQLASEKLRREQEELEEQLREYQQSLERLREGQRSVERQREHLENQRKLLQTWNHGRQSSLPAVIPHMVIPLDEQQDSPPSHPRDYAGNGSVFVNEAAFTSASFNNRHFQHKRNDPSAHNCFNTLLVRSNGRQSPIVPTPHGQHSDSQEWVMGTGYFYDPAGRLRLQDSASEHGYNGETWMSTASGADPYVVLPHPDGRRLDLSHLVSLETDSDREEGREETIVYL